MPAKKVAGCKTCGSELARDGAMTSNIIFDCQAAIASKLAPTGVWWFSRDVFL